MYFRLTPPYMLLLMVGTVLVPFFNNGPMWADGDNPTMTCCRDNWWTNLLYINNYVKTDKMVGRLEPQFRATDNLKNLKYSNMFSYFQQIGR